ncbi:THC0290_0291 family protein [Winogradskyella psychrotolerans]|uniref:THC0290_0291 family protein n=1 Tax=Winogradskyella psychrotolerans TaxID=1344585 RepID=UPI001C06CF64|nr:glutamate dehydrogenase [Winogradskyella psychrotolerans]
MTLKIKHLYIALVLLLSMQMSYSQSFSHEVGIIAGPIIYQSDFGERYDFETNTGNIGFGIGLVYYMNFDYLTSYYSYSRNNFFTNHFKVRAEISWNKTNLSHFGQWVDDDRTSTAADKLRAHSGEAQNFNIGAQLEYYPLSTRALSRGGDKFGPFVSLGAQYVIYNPGVSTTYGDENINDPNNFYPSWEPGSIDATSGSTWSIVGSVGVRYNLNAVSHLMADLRIQRFMNDDTDGLDHQLDSNKTNDWLAWFNVGYIFMFD